MSKKKKIQLLVLQLGKLSIFFFLISEHLAVWEHLATAQHVKPCQVLHFFSCFEVKKYHPANELTKKGLIVRPLPEMINPSKRALLSFECMCCAVSLPVIVLFLLFPSSVSLPFIWKEGKNVWIEEGDFPTVTQLREIHYCGQVPIPLPCCSVHRCQRHNVLIIKCSFFSLFEKYVMENIVKCSWIFFFFAALLTSRQY